MSTTRMTANPTKPSRHRPNKGVVEQDSSDSDSGEEEVSQPIKPPPKVPSASGITTNLSKLDVNERRKIAAAKEQARLDEEKLLKAKAEEGFETESEEESQDESSGEDESSEEEESEEEAPRRVMMRPTFIRKDKRNNIAPTKETQTEEEMAAEKEAERVAKADSLLEDAFAEARAAKEAAKKDYVYRGEREDIDDVDTDDEAEPEVAEALWRLREIKRLKREREKIEEHEMEIAELERRRALTEEERKLEDDEHIAKQKDERESKGKMEYMQKYFHKGAFYADDAKAQGLDRRELMGAKFADDVDRELLPKALQMRDMTKVGKRGATKYKDLKSEDTGSWGQFADKGPRRGGSGGFGQDERFMPDRERGAIAGGSGANSMPVTERRRETNAPEDTKTPRSRTEGDPYHPSNRQDGRRSRSRSPRRERDKDHQRRKRSISGERTYSNGDKRRRVDEK